MNLYAFILGRKNLLSIAELINVIGKLGKIIEITPEALIAVLNEPLSDAQKSLNILGGTIKIAEIFGESSDKDDLPEIAGDYLTKNFGNSGSKIIYGLSVYSFKEKQDVILRKTLNLIKKILVQADAKSRFINHNFRNVETAAIIGEKLIQKGTEIVVVQGRYKIFAGRTLAVQDIDSYTNRDINRPERDPHLGMLPPKLAQIMINLSGENSLSETPKTDQIIYDPFVGTGTIPMEALLIGFGTVGSDIDSIILNKAQKNLAWIRNQSVNNISAEQQFRLFVKDACLLKETDLPEKIAAVVTESYLGPALTRLPSKPEIDKNFSRISEMLKRFFGAIGKILKTGTPVIISIPAYKSQNKYIRIENFPSLISDNIFKIEPLISHAEAAKYNISISKEPSLIYDRPDQIVGREIYKIVKK